MNSFIEPLKQWKDYESVCKELITLRGTIEISGCLDANKPHLIYALGQGVDSRLVVVGEELKARELYEDYRVFDEDVLFLPAKDVLFYSADVRGGSLARERQAALQALAQAKRAMRQVTVITCFDALMNIMPLPDDLSSSTIVLRTGDEVDTAKFAEELTRLGYEREYQVSMPGQFAIRGGIVDVFPLTSENPMRIELWGDEIDTIREFDTENQRSLDLDPVEKIRICPAVETMLIRDGNKGCLLDYLDPDNSIIFLDEPARLELHGKAVEAEYVESVKQRLEFKVKGMDEVEELYSASLSLEKTQGFPCVSLCTLSKKVAGIKVKKQVQLRAVSVSAYNNSFELLIKDLKKHRKNKYKCVLMSGSRTRAQRLAADITDNEVPAFYTENREREIKESEVAIFYGKLRKGFEYPELGFAMISESDIFGQEVRKKKKHKKYSGGETIKSFGELHTGDYIVHEGHGVGIYRGIEKIMVDGISKDYMKLEYAGGSVLYILATQLDMIQKYQNSTGENSKKPKLNTLGSPDWGKTKTKVRGALREVAEELVQLYAVRENSPGYQFSPDSVWQTEFEELFPFEETEDQITAIEDTKRDMESSKIMDRLICGDVGFGKTEVAIRAAFKAVNDGKQVAYLVPTTILAQQHFNTFSQRMKDYPIKVEMLSRFRTPTQQKKIAAGVKNGEIDIIIGTHRLLSKDMDYKDLGLLIIDEEQRFGVTHKEKIKQLKQNVDVLTLTATPIPRTLHMSLVGIRDMSLLEEPPLDRVPIQTYVMEYNEELVREAIARELARQGQVYYVFNRVDQIADVAAVIQRLVPEANVAYAHGRMSESQLEDIMYSFVNGEIDVLVSTTIIETGLDISNVNTIIIQDADKMGLSQLYQLRGRVGRSNRTAFAFFMYRPGKVLKEIAEKRLAAIREFTDLGSGFKISMRDLEIRGAGSLLGENQSGHMAAIGYEMYCKMLSDAVREAKGLPMGSSGIETTIDIQINAFIPERYIANEFQRLEIYKKIATISSDEDYSDVCDELTDRFGDIPSNVMNLIEVAKLKARARALKIVSITQKENTLSFVIYEKADVNPIGIPDMINKLEGALIFIPDKEKPTFLYKMNYNSRQRKKNVLEYIEFILCELSVLYDETLAKL